MTQTYESLPAPAFVDSEEEEELPLPSPPPLHDLCNSPVAEPKHLLGLPSLPEPTEKPPPPPMIHQDEPIYESIPPRMEPLPVVQGGKRKSLEAPTSPSPPVAETSWKYERENREARRKQRIVRKLQELEEDDLQLVAQHVNQKIKNH